MPVSAGARSRPSRRGIAIRSGNLPVAPDGTSAVYAYLQPDSQIWMMEQVKER